MNITAHRCADCAITAAPGEGFYVEAQTVFVPYGRPVINEFGSVIRFGTEAEAEALADALRATRWARTTTYAAGPWPPAPR